MYQKVLFSALAIMVSSAVYAADDNNFKMLDTDNSGTISEIEASALPALSAKWTKYDSNGNSELDEAEFARFETEEIE